ncbi:MAG TPA: TatD family hydrolase [Caulobacteraceae bacterium]|nr:TatD family hydrolase [Caulobacteraceae bacterium]
MLIDSHVNLHATQFDDDREAVIARARAAGVGLMLTICDRIDRFGAAREIAETHADIWCTVGVHPHESKDFLTLSVNDLTDRISDRVAAIGESGLDFHYEHSPPTAQVQVFRTHIHSSQQSGLPLVVHTRAADTETAEILEEEYARAAFPILMHCYTGGAELARRAAALGASFAVSGIATFKAAEAVRGVIRDLPAERLLVETDCPYLAPVPMRGRRNEPAFLPHVLAKLAELKGWSPAEAEARTADAFFRLFERIPRP